MEIEVQYCPLCPYYWVSNEVMRAGCSAPVPEEARPVFVPLETASPYRTDLPPPEDCPLRSGPLSLTVSLKS